MAESPEEYTARLLRHAAGADPRSVLAATPNRLATLGHDHNHLAQIDRLREQARTQ